MEEIRVPIEPDSADTPQFGLGQFQATFPLQPGKIQRPLLPEETLRRDRLLNWIGAHSDRRIIYVVAEAGFGKTTLVADYTRRSRLRTFWYRLDDGDTDGLVFLRYLIASCQSVDGSLLARAAALLSESSIEPLRQETVLEAALAEIDRLGEVPSVLVLDDFHTAEETSSVREVVERLAARAPKSLTIILLGRRTPMLSVAAVRARGELAELDREALRFDETETARLFNEAYRHDLDAGLVHELQTRTEGWAASLGLVHTAVEGRTPGQVREFVDSLTGAEGSLYDYLAEEVVGELDADLRQFLLRVVLLEEIDQDTAALAADVAPAQARRLISQAQRLSLLAKGDSTIGVWRAHPLVRDYLTSLLESEVGADGVATIHRHLASLLEKRSWRLAARHWASAEEADQVRRVICAAVPAIIGTGDFTAAVDLIGRFPDPNPNPWYDIIHSRQCAADGRYEEALALARRASDAVESAGTNEPLLVASSALNLLYLGIQAQEPEMRKAAAASLAKSSDPEFASIAQAAELQAESSEGGSLNQVIAALLETARLNRLRGHSRHEGISFLNLTLAEVIAGRHGQAAEHGRKALSFLTSSGSAGDVAAARANTARALAHLGSLEDWEAQATAVLSEKRPSVEPETVAEIAELQGIYGDTAKGLLVLKDLHVGAPRVSGNPYYRQVEARFELSRGNAEAAIRILEGVGPYPLCPGFKSAVTSLTLQARAYSSPDDPSLLNEIDQALAFAEGQQAWFWWKTIRLTRALVSSAETLSDHVSALGREDAAYLSIQAELLVRRLADLDERSFDIVRREAELRPARWRWALRRALREPACRVADIRRGTELLDLVGNADDIELLRTIAHRKVLRIPDAGRALIRRLAAPVYVEDLGRMEIRIGDRAIPGTDVRKKVLSLLAYLLTRPQFTASREQVIEALWPEMAPDQGANSLNQTAYFLRRIFEPEADDDTSAGYLNSRGDLIWLDPELVHSRSSDCLKLIAAARRDPSPEVIGKLADSYTGKFAIDLMYEDWAAPFRETLHAGFLDRIERARDLDTRACAYDRALGISQLALQADPDADQIELCLLRLYRLTGRHAAAAEQYVHYASVMREQLGVEPPPLEAI
jgi:ATP/maltotriose-dependent transcriptional regulator MalT/DNA-binding SARP family transcriptional activator